MTFKIFALMVWQKQNIKCSKKLLISMALKKGKYASNVKLIIKIKMIILAFIPN